MTKLGKRILAGVCSFTMFSCCFAFLPSNSNTDASIGIVSEAISSHAPMEFSAGTPNYTYNNINGSVYWDYSNSTLYLTNFGGVIDTKNQNAITINGDATIVLIGTNTIKGVGTSNENAAISCSGTLVIRSTDLGQGILNIKSSSSSTYSSGYGIYAQKSLYLNNVLVNIEDSFGEALRCSGDILALARSSVLNISNCGSMALFVKNGSLNISTSSAVIAKDCGSGIYYDNKMTVDSDSYAYFTSKNLRSDYIVNYHNGGTKPNANVYISSTYNTKDPDDFKTGSFKKNGSDYGCGTVTAVVGNVNRIAKKYKITNCVTTVTVNKKTSIVGKKITVKGVPGEKYYVSSVSTGETIAVFSGSGTFKMPACDVIIQGGVEISEYMVTATRKSYMYIYDKDYNQLSSFASKNGKITINLGKQYANKTLKIYTGKKSSSGYIKSVTLNGSGKIIVSVTDGQDYSAVIQ